MKKELLTGLTVAAALLSTPAFAGPDCTSEPKDSWMSEMDMQKKIVNDYGFTMYKFKVTSGNCYEIYGTAPKSEDNIKERVKTEIYFHPITGEIIKQKIKD